MIRVGFIGCGGIIERRHLPGLLERSDIATICAVSDIDSERAASVADVAGVPARHRYSEYAEMLEREALDLVIVATPLAHHEGPVVRAAGRVATVLVEKPLGADVASAERMIEACRASGTGLSVVHNQLFRPAVEAAADLLGSGELGMPFLYRDELLGASHRVGSGTDPDWRTQRQHAAGGCLIDNAYHSVYLAERLLGQVVVSVQAQVATFTHDYDVEDTALAILRHSDGALSSIQASWGITSGRDVAHRVFEIHASNGSILFENQGATLQVARPGQSDREMPEVAPERQDDAGYYVFRDRFLDALQSGGPLPVTGEEGLHALAVVAAAYASTERGQAVAVAR